MPDSSLNRRSTDGEVAASGMSQISKTILGLVATLVAGGILTYIESLQTNIQDLRLQMNQQTTEIAARVTPLEGNVEELKNFVDNWTFDLKVLQVDATQTVKIQHLEKEVDHIASRLEDTRDLTLSNSRESAVHAQHLSQEKSNGNF